MLAASSGAVGPMPRKPATELERFLDESTSLVNNALETSLPSEAEPPEVVHRAMRASVLLGGKRIRSNLALATARTLKSREERVLGLASAVECIHSCSLILDDLPCMDDAHVRRGRPTCHREFGEATAILAADALLMLGFGLIAEAGARSALSRHDLAALVKLASDTVG